MRKSILLLVVAAALVFSGCRKESPGIKVALLPILDSLPGYVAAANGYFADYGVQVEIIPVSSALDRDQIMQSGEADCMLAELSATALFNADSIQLKTIATVRKSDNDFPLFRIVAGRNSGISGREDLKGRSVAAAENTVTEYIAYRILQNVGFEEQDISFQSVPVIPERFGLLMSGQIDAAILPDPLASTATAMGHRAIVDDTVIPGISMSVLSATTASLEMKEEQMESFLEGWFEAVREINRNPEQYLQFYMETLPAAEDLDSYFAIPPFPSPQIPAEAAWDDMTDWLRMKGILDTDVDYRVSVTSEYLPQG